MTCGWLPQANQAANRKCPISAGSTIGIQWHHNSNAPSDNILDPTHKGPVIVYLAKSDTGAGDVWFKIFEDGFADGKWGVDRMLDNRGRVDITIPSDIAPGNYLLRGEILAHHNSYDLNGVQPYVGCVELTISSTGTVNPSGVAFPGYYKNTDPGILLNIYQTITSYIVPGPALYTPSSSSSSSAPAPSVAATTAPSSAPTTTPSPSSSPSSSSGESVKVQVNSGSNVWWFAVDVSGGSEETVKVELMDSGVVSNFHILSKFSYGFFFSQSVQLTMPVSLRLTSASGKQVVLEKYITSFNDGAIKDTNQNYSSSVTPAPAK